MSTQITAKGQLQHHFWGDYCADLVLKFESGPQCAAALSLLSLLDVKWNQGTIKPELAFIHVNSEQLKRLITKLTEHGADPDKIDSCAKNIDYGEVFTVGLSVEVIDPDQLALL